MTIAVCLGVFSSLLLTPSRLVSQWALLYPDIPASPINDMCFLSDRIGFAVNAAGSILATTDGGETWKVRAHYQRVELKEIAFVDALHGFVFSPHSYTGDNIPLVYTTDGGSSWNSTNVSMTDAVTFHPVSTTTLLKGTTTGAIQTLDNFYGLWRTTYQVPRFFAGDYFAPYGTVSKFSELKNGAILALGASTIARGSHVISDSVSFILRSADKGSSWDTLWCGLRFIMGTIAFADSNVGWIGGEENRIYKTADGGHTWTLQYAEADHGSISSLFAVDSMTAYAITSRGVLIQSRDGGKSWNQTLIEATSDRPRKVFFPTPWKGLISGARLRITSDTAHTWRNVSHSSTNRVYRLAFVDDHRGWCVDGTSGEVMKTTDGGKSWSLVFALGNEVLGSIQMLDSTNGWIAGRTTIYKTIDAWGHWTSIPFGPDAQSLRGVYFYNRQIGLAYEVRYSPNNLPFNLVTVDGGASWTRFPAGNGTLLSSFFKVKATDPGHIWFANSQGLWLSRDTARTWTLVSNVGSFDSAFDVSDSLHGWIATSDQKKLARTSDGGMTWEYFDKPFASQSLDLEILGADYSGHQRVLVSGYDGSLLQYTDTFPMRSLNTFTNAPLFDITTYRTGNTVHEWVGGDGFIVLYRQDFVTAVASDPGKGISGYSLSQNFPNPFNPTTVISFQLSVSGMVSLRIFNLLGQEVAMLLNELKSPGFYQVTWKADVPSGIYFYRLQAVDASIGSARGFLETKKMILIR